MDQSKYSCKAQEYPYSVITNLLAPKLQSLWAHSGKIPSTESLAQNSVNLGDEMKKWFLGSVEDSELYNFLCLILLIDNK